MNRRMRILSVLSSSNQMYSGIGRAVFELTSRLRGRADHEFAIDDRNPRNVALVQHFAADHDIPVHVGRGSVHPDSLDNANLDLADLLSENRWDVVESVCWANAATNATLLDANPRAAFVYTPHDQPGWTVPMSPSQAVFTETTHRRMIERSELVLCDSPWERGEILRRAPGKNNGMFLPLGCDFRTFRPGPAIRKPQLLFVGDLAEPRKRFDRVLNALEVIRTGWPEVRLVVIGNGSQTAQALIPQPLRDLVELRGYVSESELRQAYSESLGLILLSEFEAFGIPILEALASGTPVFLTEMAPTRSLFGEFLGAHFCPGDDVWETSHILERELERNRASIAEAIADRRRLQAVFDWDLLAEKKWRGITAAWYGRNAWSWTA